MLLKLGKMSSRELADWFNISYGTYRKVKAQRLETLSDYCDFEEIYGGVIIKEIYIDTYDKDLNKRIDKMVLQEIKETNGLMSISGMAKKLSLSTYEERLANKSRANLFGQFSKENPIMAEGKFGFRKAVWAIKINDIDAYRKLSEDERIIWRQVLDQFYNKKLDEEEVLLKVSIAEYCLAQKKTLEEYTQMLNDYGFNFFGLAVSKFKDQTGLQIVHISEHELEMGEARLRESYPEEAAKIAQYYKAISN